MELHTKAKPVNAVVNNSILEGSSVLNDPNRFIWGGSVVKGSDNKYHMLYNTWHCGDSIPKFSDSWVLHSEIAYAISDKPDRDFVFQKIVLKGAKSDGNAAVWDAQMVTNPHIKQFGNTYYLYYVGSKDPGIQQENSDGKGINKRNRVQQMLRIGVIEFNSFEDLVAENFTRPKEPLLAPRTRVKPNNIIAPSPPGTSPKPDNIIVVNPSIVRRPVDGKYLMYFKGNLYDPNWRGVHGVAISDNPSGPFVPKDDIIFDFKMEDGRLASAEDPYVWYHNTLNRFYAVFKDFSGKITGSEPGLALLESLDGLQWTKPTNPFFMKKEVTLINGDIIKLNRLERPQLLIDANGNPQVLYAAGSIVNINPRQDGSSFNIQIPIEAYVK
ncbi:glycoside hydrolase family protein [Aurantibacter sp.]|uniref:glycoside hydrolase family protein n=1 Tax=Aurantibacter sp. TaxID=2807103 RepID=UPI003266890E